MCHTVCIIPYLGALVAVGPGGLALRHAGGERVGEVLQDGRVVSPAEEVQKGIL